MKTYAIVTGADKRQGIKCLRCKCISWSQADVMKKYCGSCERFHDVCLPKTTTKDLRSMTKFERTVSLVGQFRESLQNYQEADNKSERWKAWLAMQEALARGQQDISTRVEFDLLTSDVQPETLSELPESLSGFLPGR